MHLRNTSSLTLPSSISEASLELLLRETRRCISGVYLKREPEHHGNPNGCLTAVSTGKLIGIASQQVFRVQTSASSLSMPFINLPPPHTHTPCAKCCPQSAKQLPHLRLYLIKMIFQSKYQFSFQSLYIAVVIVSDNLV